MTPQPSLDPAALLVELHQCALTIQGMAERCRLDPMAEPRRPYRERPNVAAEAARPQIVSLFDGARWFKVCAALAEAHGYAHCGQVLPDEASALIRWDIELQHLTGRVRTGCRARKAVRS